MTAATITLPIELKLTPKSQSIVDLLMRLNTPAADQPAPALDATDASAPMPPAHGEYWPGQGGRYICTLPALLGMPARHLIAGALSSKEFKFGPYEEITGAGSHIDGRVNTAALLASGHQHPAAQYAKDYTADGHTDFFLPAKLDLVMAHICAQSIGEDNYVWSSTQVSSDGALVQSFELGFSFWGGKANEYFVVPVRVIQL